MCLIQKKMHSEHEYKSLIPETKALCMELLNDAPGNKHSVAVASTQLANLQMFEKDYYSALENAVKAQKIVTSVHGAESKKRLADIFFVKAQCYVMLGDKKKGAAQWKRAKKYCSLPMSSGMKKLE